MPGHPSITEVSRSFRILETLLTKNRSLNEMKFAINTIVNSSKYMHDTLQEIAGEVEKSTQEGRNRERDLAASNARREMRIKHLKQIVEAKRAAQEVSEQGINNRSSVAFPIAHNSSPRAHSTHVEAQRRSREEETQ